MYILCIVFNIDSECNTLYRLLIFSTSPQELPAALSTSAHEEIRHIQCLELSTNLDKWG